MKGEIVDREKGSRPLPPGMVEQCREQSGMPVVAMHNIGTPVRDQIAERYTRRDMIEKRKALRVVRPVLTMLILVEPTCALKQLRTVYQPNRQTRIWRVCGNKSGATDP